MAIEIVDLPIKNGGSFHSYVNVYQRVTNGWCGNSCKKDRPEVWLSRCSLLARPSWLGNPRTVHGGFSGTKTSVNIAILFFFVFYHVGTINPRTKWDCIFLGWCVLSYFMMFVCWYHKKKPKWYTRSHILLCSANFIGWYPMISHVFLLLLSSHPHVFFYWGFFLDIIKYPRISNMSCFLFVNPCWFFEKLHHWVLKFHQIPSNSIKFSMISPFLAWWN